MSVVVRFKTLPTKRGPEKPTLAELLIMYNLQTEVEAQMKIEVSTWTRVETVLLLLWYSFGNGNPVTLFVSF